MSTPPTLVRFPDGAVDFSFSILALEFLTEAGYSFDDWQEWALWWSEARTDSGDLAAKHIYGEVPRQNGKNIWLEGSQLAGLLLFGYTLFRHSAYRADTAHEHFLSLQERILDDKNGLLYEYVTKTGNQGFFSANGKEQIVFANKARLLFQTRQKQSGRGPRPQKLYFDEALILDPETVNAQVPSITAQQGSQVFFASSAPLADSEYQHMLRKRAGDTEDEEDRRYFAVMWNNEADIDDRDQEAIRRVNPSFGQGRMTLESVELNRRLMTLTGYIREHLGVPDDPPNVEGGPISIDAWADLAESTSTAKTHRTVALGVSADRKWATIGVAGRREDGLYHLEWKARKPGTKWVVDEAAKLVKAGYTLLVHATGPESTLLAKFDEADIDYDEISTSDLGRYTDTMIDLVNQQAVRHLGQKTIQDQLSIAAHRLTPEGVHIWSASRSDGPIDALKAVTIALGGAYNPETESGGDWFSY